MELYDFGTSDDGTFYYVMELLDGLDLDTLITKHGPVPPERAIHYLTQLCRSLADAHQQGLVHRDIKPANVFACRLGFEVDYIKVLDFGLVKAQQQHVAGAEKLSADNLAIGTPAFMPPELALGKAVDSRADLYAVGCVGYWLLTGELVFVRDAPLQTVLAHVNEEAPLPSTRTELQIPKPLEDVIMACLAKEPEDRPQSAQELIESLEALEPERPWTDARRRQWWSLHAEAVAPAAAQAITARSMPTS